MGKLIPIILILVGAGAGIGAGLMLRPAADTEMMDASADKDTMAAMDGQSENNPDALEDGEYSSESAGADDDSQDEYSDDNDKEGVASIEYVALRRQMIVPLVEGNRVGALIVLSLSIEAVGGNIELIYDREPKLRDEFLQVLFRHANTGGFDGMFTSGEAMSDLKSALNAAAQNVLGSVLHQVLITEILRQEI